MADSAPLLYSFQDIVHRVAKEHGFCERGPQPRLGSVFKLCGDVPADLQRAEVFAEALRTALIAGGYRKGLFFISVRGNPRPLTWGDTLPANSVYTVTVVQR